MTVAPNPRRDFVPDRLDSEIEESGQRAWFGAASTLSGTSIPVILSHTPSPDGCRERAINFLKPKSQALAGPTVDVLRSSPR
jgi:hypothetical protein